MTGRGDEDDDTRTDVLTSLAPPKTDPPLDWLLASPERWKTYLAGVRAGEDVGYEAGYSAGGMAGWSRNPYSEAETLAMEDGYEGYASAVRAGVAAAAARDEATRRQPPLTAEEIRHRARESWMIRPDGTRDEEFCRVTAEEDADRTGDAPEDVDEA